MKVFFFVMLAANIAAAGPAQKADTLVGVTGHGSCMPGPCLPHASIYPSPDSLYPFKGRRFASPSGIFFGDPVTGFSQLHTQGTGGTPSYGLFLVSPRLGEGMTEEENASPLTFVSTRCFGFRGRMEKWQTDVAIAPTAHAAIYRFSFPAAEDARLVLNIARKIGFAEAMTSGSVTISAKDKAISGGGTFDHSWNPAPYQAFFYAVLDTEPKAFGTWSGDAAQPGQEAASLSKRGKLGAWCSFDTRERRPVQMKIAVSFKSVEQAKAWLEAELPNWDLENTEKRAEAVWDEMFSAVRAEGLAPREERLFYSHLFHTMVQPRDRTNDFEGWDKDQPVWDDHYTLWDTWKTLFPLMAIIQPEMVAGNVNSFAARMKRDKECSAAFIQGREYRVGQGGDEADNIIADAYAKKIPGVNWEKAWAVLAGDAARRTPEYRTMGWMPSDVRHDYCGRLKSGSATIAFAYNDWCASQVAMGLGKVDDAARLLARSGNWTNVWDATAVDKNSGFTGFVRGRLKSGAFGVPAKGGPVATEPRKGYNTDFYEGTCWEYSFVVPHDITGMIARMGGREKFTERLRYALENNLIDFGNEPSFMTIWLFDFVGRPDLTSFWADKLRAKFPDSGPPGDDDSGAMGSLYVFMTAGFFPFSGQDIYALHGPSARRIDFLARASGKTFTVIGENAGGRNIYIQAATLNGKPLPKPFIRHADILAGGVLTFIMGDKPSTWGSEK